MAVTDSDLGWKAIKRELERAKGREVAVGILQGSVDGDGTSIAEYAAYNEFGTDDEFGNENIHSRPFMAMSFDENKADIEADFTRQGKAMVEGKRTANEALTIIGQNHAGRIQTTITGRDILPKLADSTIKAKGSTKTLVDTGAMANAVQISIRRRQG
jgi:hypothetical protein